MVLQTTLLGLPAERTKRTLTCQKSGTQGRSQGKANQQEAQMTTRAFDPGEYDDEAYELRRQRRRRSVVRCRDGLCGADDCERCGTGGREDDETKDKEDGR